VFDATPDAAQLATGQAWRQALAQPVLMFASSRDGEENDFLKQIVAVAQDQRAQAAIDSVASSRLGQGNRI
jgi:3-deoxy-D-manno-octulosonic-acid transferase